MFSFETRRWSPPGSRPHVLAVPGADHPVAKLAAAYVEQARRWWAETGDGRAFEQVLAPVPPPRLHLTLGWVDAVTSTLPPDALAQIAAVLESRLPRAGVRLRVGPAIAAGAAIELYVEPCDELDVLVDVVRHALRFQTGRYGVADSAVYPPGPCRPHVAIAYAQDEVDTDSLALALRGTQRLHRGEQRFARPVSWTLAEAVVVDQDTWPDTDAVLDWVPGSVRTVALPPPAPEQAELRGLLLAAAEMIRPAPGGYGNDEAAVLYRGLRELARLSPVVRVMVTPATADLLRSLDAAADTLRAVMGDHSIPADRWDQAVTDAVLAVQAAAAPLEAALRGEMASLAPSC